MDQTYAFIFLKDHPEWAPLVAEWSFSTWHNFYPEWTLESNIQRYYQHARKDRELPLTIVAVYDGKPVGMCSLRENNGYPSSQGPWLSSLFVVPDFRLKGIGKLLVQAVVDTAKNLHFKNIFLYTFNQTMPSWYENNFGWEVVEKDIFHEKPITIMKKSL